MKGSLIKKAVNLASFQDVLKWHEDHVDVVGTSIKLNADCMIHAALEDDKDRLKLLYRFGYRLGPDTDR